MLDRAYILAHADKVAENCRNRGVDVDVAAFVSAETARRAADKALQEAQAAANALASAKDLSVDQKREQGKALREKREALKAEADRLAAEADALLIRIPNLTHPESPIGRDDKDNKEIARNAVPIPAFDFKPRDHVALGDLHGIIDTEGGSKVAGPGFYFLKGDGALLELALQNFAVNFLAQRGYVPHITPDIARDSVLMGTGFVPRGNETNTYHIEETELSLIATSEITLCGLYQDTILDAKDLPIRIAGVSHCFRTERAAGRATRGLYRVHQFTKVEMVVIAPPENSEALHRELLANERDIFDALEIPYRVLDICTGDLGAAAYRKYDLEAWMPGRGDGGEFGEITSTSNCTEFQARRLNIRYRTGPKEKPLYAHTLNGTAIALGRAMIAILENNQRADGTIAVPKVLRPFLGKDVLTPPAKT
ncbi:MAG: serine--tRNA ligase [Tagaea sp.]|nr:serine--tRNA ligase [Azospirillum sp.]MCZ8122540.1 serine--tRNA ligase [Magnetospirillum sp.]